MYECIKHGESQTEFCEKCNRICECNHRDLETLHHDLIIDCKDGDRTPTILIIHCSTCGEILQLLKQGD